LWIISWWVAGSGCDITGPSQIQAGPSNDIECLDTFKSWRLLAPGRKNQQCPETVDAKKSCISWDGWHCN